MLDTRRFWPVVAAAVVLLSAALLLGVTSAQEAEAPPAKPKEEPPADERVAYLGVQLEEETDHPEGGARITEVVEDSPAEKAGLAAGDIVVEFAGATIRGPAALTRQIHAKAPGDKVSIRALRDGRERVFDVELGDRAKRARPYGYAFAPMAQLDTEMRDRLERGLRQLERPRVLGLGDCSQGENCGFALLYGGRPRLGVELVDTTPELRRHLGSTDDSGVLVGKVLRGMPAEHAGLRVGDLIVEIGDQPVTTVDDLREALSERGGETFSIRVIRDKKPVDLEVTLPGDEDGAVTGPQARLLPAPPAPPPAPVRPVAVAAPPAAPSVPSPPAASRRHPTPPPPPAPPAPPRARDAGETV